MDFLFLSLLILATLTCALVAGTTLIFAIVIMPGLRALDDHAFLKAFKAIDRIIQNNQPVFMVVWVGSALALIVATILGFTVLQGMDLALLIAALALYIPGVQLATVIVNIPLNNRLQALSLGELSPEEMVKAREAFEPHWIRWNIIRTWFAILTTVLLLVLLLRL